MSSKIKIIAMYFTQLHAIAENDEWWGKGFTDWVNVKKAEPLFDGHYQPRVPANSDYYDQSQVETIKKQVDLAKKYGIYGFCHYHYWFDGKHLLKAPTDLWLQHRDVDFPFCLSWANETWSRRWDGKDHDILIQQTHPPTTESWARHFDYLIEAWTDERAIKIDGKPVFVIYRPQKIDHIDEMLAFWNKRAKETGLKGIYFVYQAQYKIPNSSSLQSFAASFQFQPLNSMLSSEYSRSGGVRQKLHPIIELLPKNVQSFIWSFWRSRPGSYAVHDYDRVWSHIVENSKSLPVNEFPGAFADWDNTARYANRATIIQGATPERFRHWLGQLSEVLQNRPDHMNYLFFNAWNEWAESAYLEPDQRYGHQYLEAIRDVISNRTGVGQ